MCWIKVSERMPTPHAVVLFCGPDLGISIGSWRPRTARCKACWQSSWGRCQENAVNHWCALPELPEHVKTTMEGI